MKNKDILNYFNVQVNNWVSGSNAGEFGLEDLVDVMFNALQKFEDKESVWSEIEMTLQSLVDDSVIEQDEFTWVRNELLKEEAALSA